MTIQLPDRLRALTVRQPWADAIVHGPKRVENRTWGPKDPPEVFVLHAAAGKTDARGIDFMREHWPAYWDEDRPRHPRGTARALVQLRDVVVASDFQDQEKTPWWSGPKVWRLGNVVPFERPVALRGAQGLFEVDDPDVRLEAERALRRMNERIAWASDVDELINVHAYDAHALQSGRIDEVFVGPCSETARPLREGMTVGIRLPEPGEPSGRASHGFAGRHDGCVVARAEVESASFERVAPSGSIRMRVRLRSIEGIGASVWIPVQPLLDGDGNPCPCRRLPPDPGDHQEDPCV